MVLYSYDVHTEIRVLTGLSEAASCTPGDRGPLVGDVPYFTVHDVPSSTALYTMADMSYDSCAVWAGVTSHVTQKEIKLSKLKVPTHYAAPRASNVADDGVTGTREMSYPSRDPSDGVPAEALLPLPGGTADESGTRRPSLLVRATRPRSRQRCA